MSPLFCTRPFEWFEVHADGSVFCCCPAWVKKPLGNLLQQDFEQIWNGDRARLLRRTPLHGCSHTRCPHLVSGSGPVQQSTAANNAELHSLLVQKTGHLPQGPRTLNLCHDTTCNLCCPSCRKSPVVTDTELVNRLTARILGQIAPHVEFLRLSGYGDPFASPAYHSLLLEYQPLDWPHLRHVHLHSNGQLWDAKAWQHLNSISPLVQSAEISLDAASANTYTINRPGGDFSRLLNNLAFISTLPLELTLSFVVQANNFHEMPIFVELAERFGARAYFSQLVNWGTFSREEFLQRAVHLPQHPFYPDFLNVLASLDNHPRADLGNLKPFLSSFTCKSETSV